MVFLGGLPTSTTGFDYLFVVVDRFSKMVILIPCKKTISGEGASKLFFHHVWKHFRLPTSIISDQDNRFLGHFWKSLWGFMDTKLKRSTAFHPQTDGQIEVVNRTMVHLLRGYNSKHPCTWDASLPYLQFAFNRAIHSSTMVFLVGDKQNGEENDDRLKAQRLLECISKIHKEMYSVINAEYLKPFGPSLLDDDEDFKDSQLPPLDNLWFEREDPFMVDCILEKKATTT
ncbi:unnamed protein product, partial [Prunus brigantina]